jgi:hypothetical protein
MSHERTQSPVHTAESVLRLNFRVLDVLRQLPGDRMKMTLLLLQRARWVPSSAEQGAPIELQFHLRVEELWEAILLDRDAVGDVIGYRQVLVQLQEDPSLTLEALESDGADGGTP